MLLQIIGGVLLLCLILIIRLFVLFSKNNQGITKIGYVMREDSRKYFEAIEIVAKSIQERYAKGNRDLIQEAIQEVMNKQGEVVADNIARASAKGDAIIQRANQEAKMIISEAQTEKEKVLDRIMSQSTYIMEKSISNFIQDNFTVEQQQDIAYRKIVGEFLKDVNRE